MESLHHSAAYGWLKMAALSPDFWSRWLKSSVSLNNNVYSLPWKCPAELRSMEQKCPWGHHPAQARRPGTVGGAGVPHKHGGSRECVPPPFLLVSPSGVRLKMTNPIDLNSVLFCEILPVRGVEHSVCGMGYLSCLGGWTSLLHPSCLGGETSFL